MIKYPLSVRRFIGVTGNPAAYIISDARGRSINICCDIDQLRREVAHLWSIEEAEALAKKIARMLTDEAETQWAIDELARQNAAGNKKPSK